MRRRFTYACASLAFALGAIAAPGSASDRDDLVAKQKEQEAQIEQYQASLEGVDSNLQAVYLKLRETEAKIPVAEAELQVATGELAAATREQETVAAQLDAAQTELDSITTDVTDGESSVAVTRRDLGAIARSQYRGDRIPSTWDLLAGSSSSEDFMDAVSASRAALRKQSAALTALQQETASAKNRQVRQEAVEQTIAELKQKADEVVGEKAQKEAAAQSKAKELADLQTSYAQQSGELEGQKASFQASLAATNAAKDETAAQIAKIDEENRKAAEAAAAAARAKAGSGSSGADVSGGNFLIPVVAKPLYVTSPFGMREYPFGGYWMHNGVDLRSRCGAEQYAPGNGTIARVIPAPGNSTHGNQIYINLGYVNGHSWVVVTNHLSGFNVRVGQSVSQGDVIGWTGQTGQVTGCHAHMEVWRDGSVVNPMALPGF